MILLLTGGLNPRERLRVDKLLLFLFRISWHGTNPDLSKLLAGMKSLQSHATCTIPPNTIPHHTTPYPTIQHGIGKRPHIRSPHHTTTTPPHHTTPYHIKTRVPIRARPCQIKTCQSKTCCAVPDQNVPCRANFKRAKPNVPVPDRNYRACRAAPEPL